jgi:hypothetical protein
MIVADSLSQVLFVKRPAGAKSNDKVNLYQVQDDAQKAKLTSVQFGVQAGQLMQIHSGAKAGDQFIISDLTSLHATTNQLDIE